jgi:hypothetical protein
MQPGTAARRMRLPALLAVVGLHLLGGLLIMRALQAPRPTETSNPVTVWLAWSGNAQARSGDRARSGPAHPPAHSPPLAAPIPPVTAPPPALAPSPNVDWTGEARAAAAASIAQDSRQRRRNSSMGSTPRSPYLATPARPMFPWSHQPLGKHYDFDPDSGLFTLRTKHCVFAIWLILPGFACVPVHVDPEPGVGDLFDHRYAPWELQQPKSLRDAQQAAP